jgi:hypothetical protein
VNELEVHLADPATITLYSCYARPGLDGHHRPDPSGGSTIGRWACPMRDRR